MLQSTKSLIGGSSLLLLLLFGLHTASSLLVVPQELPSVLSLVYSNIPQVKKGTDSRFGFGFRLGDHADFQILVELGPQKDTQPIGNQDSDNSLSKRQLSKQELRKALYQQQHQKWHEMTSTERVATNWLESWSQGIKANGNNNNKKQIKKQKQTETQNDKLALLPTMPVMPEIALKQLQLLHKMATTTMTTITTSSSTPPLPSSSSLLASTSLTTTPKPFTGGPLNLGAPAGFTLRPPLEVGQQPSQLLEIVDPRKTKAEITSELMDVSLDDDGAA